MKSKESKQLLKVVFLVSVCSAHFQATAAERAVLLHKDKNVPSSWQWLTRFEFGKWSGWSQDGISGSYAVCDLSETSTNHTDSWLISEYVDLQGANEVELGLTFMVVKCRAGFNHCKERFSLYALQTEGPVAGGISKQDIEFGNFTFVETVNATNLWTKQNPQNNQVNLTLTANSSGIYFGIRDTGACLSLTSVTLSYAYCPTVVNQGVVFQKIGAPSSSKQNTTVRGNCSERASPYPSNSTLSLMCLSSGQWMKDSKVTCQCSAGFEFVGDKCVECQAGRYKPSIGNAFCVPCPAHSTPDPNHGSCICDNGFHRAPEDAVTDGCTAPPSEPKEINIKELTDTIVVVAWSPPADNGGRADVKFDVQCSTCSNSGSCSKYCKGAQFWPASVDLTSLQVTITGLNSDTIYNITVISKNGVSGQAGVQSLQSLHKTFSIRKTAGTTISPGAITLMTENLTTTEMPPVLGTAGSQVATAIVVSVAVTFLVCFIIALIVFCFLVKMFRKRHSDKESVQSSSTQLTEFSRVETPSSNIPSAVTITDLTENDSASETPQPADKEKGSRNFTVPLIKIKDFQSESRPNSAGSSHSILSLRNNRILHHIDWTPPRSITPMLLPRKKDSLQMDLNDGSLEKRDSLQMDPSNSPRKPPEGSERAKIEVERSTSVNSWFPAEEVQVNV